MAVKTKAAILAEIATLLATNGTNAISASDVRTCLNDITDSYFDAPYMTLVMTISQAAGTPALSVLELANTTGTTITSARSSAGIYTLTSSSAIFDKTKINIPYGTTTSASKSVAVALYSGGASPSGYVYFVQNTTSILKIFTVNAAGAATDLNSLIGTDEKIYLPEVRIYV